MEGTQTNQKTDTSQKLKTVLRELKEINRRVENLEKMAVNGIPKNGDRKNPTIQSNFAVDLDR